MKKLLCVILSLALILGFLNITAYGADTFTATLIYDGAAHSYSGAYFSVYVNSKKIDTPIPPIVLESNRSLVPIREICEAIGADVSWNAGANGAASKVVISKNAKKLTLTIDQKNALSGNKTITLEAAPKIVTYNNNAKTMVPLRFVAEEFDMDVDYRADSAQIYITSNSAADEPNAAQSLSYSYESGADVVRIAFSGVASGYQAFTLDNPTRLVFDFKNANVDKLSSSYSAGKNISKIRTGNFNGAARIVFDTQELPKYDVSFENSGKTAVIKLVYDNDKNNSQQPANPSQPTNPQPAGQWTVIIDAGHGGSDPGAQGKDDSGNVVANEKDVNLSISKKLAALLKQKGVNAVLTRDSDVYLTLDERTTLANSLKADLFVSVHCNALTDTSVGGSLVMHHTSNKYSEAGTLLASNILKYLSDAWQTKNRGRMDGSKMYVIRKANMPSVIVENAFITNAQDRAKLVDEAYQQRAAEAIANGIIDTLGAMQ